MSDEDFIPLTSSSHKPREQKVNTTVFVSSLPYNATTTDLTTHFSFIGPIRHGFVATDRESGKSKGVGYVTFSLREDAERAIAELDGGAFGDKGRKIRVSWADKKPGRDERKEDKPVKKQPVAPTSTDPNAIRTLVLSGLPPDLTKAVLWKKVRKVHSDVELSYPIEGEENVAHLLFPSHGEAVKSLPKLHGHVYKGALLSCVLKKRLEKLSVKEDGPSHAGRLIIRNLAWDTTEQDLRATFLPFGPIHSVTLPTLPSKLPTELGKPAPPPRARGFAFVWFLSRKDAETAMAEINGKPIVKAGQKGKGKEDERPVAVDFALSKDKWEAMQKGDEANLDVEEKESGNDDEESDNDTEDEDEDEDDDSDDDSGNEDEKDKEDEDYEEDDAKNSEELDKDEVTGEEGMSDVDVPVKPQLPSTDVGSTLFIRNVPFEATEQELGNLFRSFGPLRYARITKDPATGRSRGTGFVCFWKTEHAEQALAEAQRVIAETGANAQPLGVKNPFALPSVLTPDPSSSLASRLVLHGRTLSVTPAVTREQATHLKEDADRAREKGDKRNTYLMREGVVFPNSPAAALLPPAEVEKRQAAFNARRALLRSNPSLYISKTRLSIRQLPLFVTDRTLKRLAIHAIREFDAEVTAGSREPLSRAEETDETLSPAVAAQAEKGKKPKRGERQTPVIQSKVVRQNEKIDPLIGRGRSKGYGFLEMRSHKDALKVLRYANNNPNVGPLLWTWWTEEMNDIKKRTEEELATARKAENTKVDIDELEGRVKKLESRIAESDDRSGGGMRGGKTLLIEFSIENIQVVKRRVERVTAPKRAAPAAEDEDEDEVEEKTKASSRKERDNKSQPRATKSPKDQKRKAESEPIGSTTELEPKGIEKLGSQIGALIGRKRKMRKTK